LTWARSEFEGLLEKTPNEVNSFLSNPAQYAAAMRKAGDAQARELLERVSECLDKERCNTFDDCISWARLKYVLSAAYVCCILSCMNFVTYFAWDCTGF
jgi:ubiquitin-activating enzyme E1